MVVNIIIQEGIIIEKGTNEQYNFYFDSPSILREVGAKYLQKKVRLYGEVCTELTTKHKVINRIKVYKVEEVKSH